MKSGRRCVMIFSVSAGAGHMRAASALRSAFLEDDPECKVIILDTFKHTSPLLEKLVLGVYMEMLRHTPSIYGYIYSRSEKGKPLSGYAKSEFNRLLAVFTAGKLLRLIEQHDPKAVICTHPFPLGVLAGIRRRGDFAGLTVGAVTDFVIHPYWVFPEVDLYLTGAEQMIGGLVELGIDGNRAHATGIPIDPAFADPVDREEVLAGYGLDPGMPTILVMGGGLGLGSLARSVGTLATLRRPCQIIVVTGNNVQLRAKIEQSVKGLPNRTVVLGYVHNVHQLMRSSDLMVSKAGGLSCAEALAAGLPMFIVDPLPGQEERNSRFLTGIGAAVAVNGIADLAEKTSRCLECPHRLSLMSAAATRFGRADAARDAVRVIKNAGEHFYTRSNKLL